MGTDYALSEYLVENFACAQFTNPVIELPNWTSQPTNISPVVDSIDLTRTSLAAESNLSLANTSSSFDGDTFKGKGSGKKSSDPDGLVSTVEPTLTLLTTYRGNTYEVNRSAVMFARAIPREAFPSPRQIKK